MPWSLLRQVLPRSTRSPPAARCSVTVSPSYSSSSNRCTSCRTSSSPPATEPCLRSDRSLSMCSTSALDSSLLPSPSSGTCWPRPSFLCAFYTYTLWPPDLCLEFRGELGSSGLVREAGRVRVSLRCSSLPALPSVEFKVASHSRVVCTCRKGSLVRITSTAMIALGI
jgi:hypothetical protein